LDFRIRAKDQIELRTPEGRVLQTHIASVELQNVKMHRVAWRSCCQPILRSRMFRLKPKSGCYRNPEQNCLCEYRLLVCNSRHLVLVPICTAEFEFVPFLPFENIVESGSCMFSIH
jgi:hypothetical protein